MTQNITPSITAIKNAVAQHSGIKARDMDVSDKPKNGMHERLLVVFLAARAGHDDASIAQALGYKNGNNLSALFNKAHRSYTRRDSCFHTTACTIAGKLDADFLIHGSDPQHSQENKQQENRLETALA